MFSLTRVFRSGKFGCQSSHIKTAVPSLNEMTEQAKKQWQLAQAYFENVKDPELVDLAINNLEAAERRYNYLLRQIREQ